MLSIRWCFVLSSDRNKLMHSSTVNSQFKNEKATTPQYQKRSVNLRLMLFGSVVFNCEKLNALYKWLSSIDGWFLRLFFGLLVVWPLFSSFDWARAVAFVDSKPLLWFSVCNVLIVFHSVRTHLENGNGRGVSLSWRFTHR